MNPATHRAALAAAAKVALVTVPLGCGGNVTEKSHAGGGDDPPALLGEIEPPSREPIPVGSPVSAVEPRNDPDGGKEPAPEDAATVHVRDVGPFESDAGEDNELLFTCRARADAGDPSEVAACCQDAVVERIQRDADGIPTPDRELVPCCEAIFAAPDPWGFDGLWTCCELTGFPQGPACTPWGPPMPPAMPADWRPVLGAVA